MGYERPDERGHIRWRTARTPSDSTNQLKRNPRSVLNDQNSEWLGNPRLDMDSKSSIELHISLLLSFLSFDHNGSNDGFVHAR